MDSLTLKQKAVENARDVIKSIDGQINEPYLLDGAKWALLDARLALSNLIAAEPSAARKLAAEQAEDEGLWFVPVYITEDVLQKALRAMHHAVEGIGDEPAACPPYDKKLNDSMEAIGKVLQEELASEGFGNRGLANCMGMAERIWRAVNPPPAEPAEVDVLLGDTEKDFKDRANAWEKVFEKIHEKNPAFITAKTGLQCVLDELDRLYGVAHETPAAPSEEDKMHHDLLLYGTGVLKREADGTVKHIPLPEFSFPPAAQPWPRRSDICPLCGGVWINSGRGFIEHTCVLTETRPESEDVQ